jgi:mono/diheme cytochrome c family protein
VTDLLTTLFSELPWPLPVRPSVENLADPESRHTVATALSQLGLAVLLLTIATVVRRGRIVAMLAAFTLIVLQLPSLDLLLVAAYPTSYRPSPTDFTAAAIADGQRVFATTCIACHGKAGDGTHGLGAVADLRQQHVWEHPVGDLYWFVSHGIDGPDGEAVMPAFEKTLSEQARWSVIDYVYALNAGSVTRGLEGWPHRVRAPAIPLTCGRLPAHGLADLRGKAVRVILGNLTGPVAALPAVNGIEVVTVWIPGQAVEAAPVSGVDCVAPWGAPAYSILAGVADGSVTPSRFLIDPDGVLRSVWRQDDGDEWDDPVRLLEEVRTICTEPLTLEPGEPHEHHH